MIQEVWHSKQVQSRKVVATSFLALVVLVSISLSVGSTQIPTIEIIKAIFGKSTNSLWQSIVIDFRIPRTLTALLAGVALSLSGLQMQTLFRNPLAGPFVLGISSGASLGVALLVIGSTWLPLSVSGLSTVLAAFIGSFGVLVVVLALSHRLKDTSSLLILGLMFGSAVSAGVSLLEYFGSPEQIQGYLFWTFGSLSGVNWSELQLFIPLVVLGLLATLLISRPLNLLNLGSDYAVSSGLSIKKIRLFIILLTSLLAGITTAFCGPIAFIGIAVPHIARLIFNTSNHHQLIPLVALIGAGVMIICDMISQLPGSTQTIPINVVTSIFGAPLVIWLILKKRKMLSLQ